MTSAQDGDPDLPDAESVDVDTEALERANDAIDQGREAAREALKDNPPDAEDANGQREQNPEP